MLRKSTANRPVWGWKTVERWLGSTESTDRVVLGGIGYDPKDVRSRDDVRRVLGLSEREFVVAILLDNGGRAMQGAFPEYTNWSASLVSRVLTELEDEGAIARHRIGREKVVGFPRREATSDREAG